MLQIPLSIGENEADCVMCSPTKAKDFEGEGGPETKQRLYEEENPGNDDVRDNIRQGGETIRPAGG